MKHKCQSVELHLLAAMLVLGAAATGFAQAEAERNSQKSFFERHCLRCHGPERQEANLRIDNLDTSFTDKRSADAWVEMLDRINLGEMPPEDEPRPTDEELEAVVNWITGQLQSLRDRAFSTGGRVLLRRLTRTEYTNTIRDLLDVRFLEGEGPQDLLPPDGSIKGFNKVSQALLLDPSLMEKYLDVAELVADHAVRVRQPLVPTRVVRFEFEDTGRAMGINYQVRGRTMDVAPEGVILYDGAARTGYELKHPFNGQQVPVTGRYKMRVRAAADPGDIGEPIYMDFTRGQQGRLQRFRVEAPLDRPQVYEFQGTLDATILAEISVSIVNRHPHFEHNPLPSLESLGRADLNNAEQQNENLRTLARYNAEGYGLYGNRPNLQYLDKSKAPKLYLDYIELEGPLHGPWPPPSMSIIFPEGLAAERQTVDYARTIFGRLLPRAYRRGVTSEELGVIVSLVESELELGKPFHEAVKVGIVGMLCAPQFLYLFEPEGDSELQVADRPPMLEARDFRDQSDRVVRGRVIAFDDDKLVFERAADQRRFTIPAATFSAADQQYLSALRSSRLSPKSPPRRSLSDFELATRLSYFLWSSMPDNELYRVARQGQLRDKQILASQVDRMLADEKAESLVNDFAYQWLRIHEFDRFAPDQGIFPDYYNITNAGIGEDMKSEPLAMFRELLRNDRSVLNFLDSEWTMLNERLAGFYGIEGVNGDEFRVVALPADSPRGGLLGMAGVHKWGSDGSRTKPVERGKYILDVLFADPPPPPPPNAGEVQPNISGQNLTVRERLEQHRTVATCANCHRRIDPYGLALENFNVIGQWRTRQDGEMPLNHWGNRRRELEINGNLPNGDAYENFAEFKHAITRQHDRFLRGLTEKMLIYALGRPLEPADQPMIHEVADATRDGEHTFRAMIQAIVASEAFQSK